MAGARPGDEERRGSLDDTVPAVPAARREGDHRTWDHAPGGAGDGDAAADRAAAEAAVLAAASGPLPAPLDGPARYRLGAELGRGGMGRVVEAFDLQLGRTVALKEVLPRGGAGTVRRFEREVQLTARLEHPSIVPIYDSGVTPDGRPFYVMRRVSGRPFDELVARARGLDERLTLLPALLAAIDAVGHAHRRGVIHRDLKPQNILVGELGETVVIDWGLAKVIGEDAEPDPSGEVTAPPRALGDSLQTQHGSVFGTPGFMSPEQARGEELGTRGDVFALGATLYQLLAGAPPLAGVSATEMIDRTARNEIRPIGEVAPGAPAELIAIVDKALSFEPGRRYATAGALAEDVRRFLAGQLVAAHRYTPRQRLARFARRHRAPLGVAAFALVTVAVLAWIGVARIMTERDTADTARAAAVAEQRAAEAARDALAERHDALLVTQAAALIETNPTEAAATLKAIAPTSPRLGDARAIAQAAVARGVAWAIENTHELTVIAELDPDGRRLLQVSRDGVVRVFDLDARRRLVERPYARDTRALWVAGGRVLVTHPRAAPQLLDPAANTSEPLAIDPIGLTAATAAGDRVIFTEPRGRTAKLLDVASRRVTELAAVAPGPARGADPASISEVAAAPDGRWFAIVGDHGGGVVVVGADGREHTRRAGTYYRVVTSADALAMLREDGAVLECRLRPGVPAVWTEVPLQLAPPHRAVDLAYRAGELDLWVTTGVVLSWNGARVGSHGLYNTLSNQLRAAGRDALLVPGAEGRIHFLNGAVRGTLVLPAVVPRARIAARPGAGRIAIAGDGIIVGYDLDDIVPRAMPATPQLRGDYIDDRTLLINHGTGLDLGWLDLPTGAVHRFTFPIFGVPDLLQLDPPTGRVLLREANGSMERLVMMRKGRTDARPITDGRSVWGRLLGGDTLVYGVGDGRVFAQIGEEPAREVAKLDGVADNAVGLGYRRFAAHSTSGELIRADLATGAVERIKVAPGATGFVAADPAGRVLVVEGDRLAIWDGDRVVEIARFGQPIARLAPFEGGAAVHLADHAVLTIDLVPGAKPHRVLLPARQQAAESFDGSLIVGVGPAQQLSIIELPSRARWTLPVLYAARPMLSVAPTSRQVVQAADGHLVFWTLPAAGADLGAWLDARTNATVDGDRVLVWPWQRGVK